MPKGAVLAGEFSKLAAYASRSSRSRGRLIEEPVSPNRAQFARDRDRIVHSTAFRRLNYKTQVFIFHEGDHYRSRLTHSIVVAQIARSLGSQLFLNEDLCEAIGLAHDMGHAPFGHAGERAMARALADFGGFDHNIQTLHVLTRLEKRYPAFDGLNLTFETMEGLIKHNGPVLDEKGRTIGAYAGRELPEAMRHYQQVYGFELHLYASPEAQVAALADDIAYNNHDIDDGLRAGLFTIDELYEHVPLVRGIIDEIKQQHKGVADDRLVFELNRQLITQMIVDVREESTARLSGLKQQTAQGVRQARRPLIAFSPAFEESLKDLQAFLRQHVYHEARVMRIMHDAEQVTEEIVGHFLQNPHALPKEWQREGLKEEERAGQVRDYVAGMTDRYILELHRTLFDVTPELR